MLTDFTEEIILEAVSFGLRSKRFCGDLCVFNVLRNCNESGEKPEVGNGQFANN